MKMTREIDGVDTVLILKEFNTWRRGHAQRLPCTARLIGEAIDAVIKEVLDQRKIKDAALLYKKAKTLDEKAVALLAIQAAIGIKQVAK